MRAFVRCLVVVLVAAWIPAAAFAQSDIESLVAQTGIEPGATATRDHPRWREPRRIVVRDIAGLYDALAAGQPGVELIRVQTEAEAIAAEVFLVEESGDELANLDVIAGQLEAVSERTGGQTFLSIDDVPALSELASTTRRLTGVSAKQPLLHPAFLALTALILAANWFVRRRWGRR